MYTIRILHGNRTSFAHNQLADFLIIILGQQNNNFTSLSSISSFSFFPAAMHVYVFFFCNSFFLLPVWQTVSESGRIPFRTYITNTNIHNKKKMEVSIAISLSGSLLIRLAEYIELNVLQTLIVYIGGQQQQHSGDESKFY